MNYRTEHDSLGKKQIPSEALWGIHTARARENFSIAGRPVHPELVKAYGAVKLACSRTNRAIGIWKEGEKAEAIERACTEMMEGSLGKSVDIDALQGGAGTSTNMSVNEVIANRALILLGRQPGNYATISPTDDINRHQSTNDTFPTAVRLACITGLHKLEQALVTLQESCQAKEKAFADIVKIGRTELMDAVLMTLGREVGAWAEAFNRDRWRIYKCEERLRVVNLGGTAIGTGLGAPREFIFRAVDELRAVTGIGFARAENMVDATQNCDVFAEVSGMLKACASNMYKVASDIRLLASGPDAGFGEITLQPLQDGSSIMPGKVNPVIPEAVTQAALRVFGLDTTIAMAAASGNLELNQNLPLIADALLESIDLLAKAATHLSEKCIATMSADRDRCARHIDNATAAATALIPLIGYEQASAIVRAAADRHISVRQAALESGVVTAARFDEAISPEAVCRLGSPLNKRKETTDATRS